MSLTPEQVALPPGARQKMPTLLGLGAAIGEVLAPENNAAPDAAPRSGIAARTRPSAATRGLEAPPDSPASNTAAGAAPDGAGSSSESIAAIIESAVTLLADFGLKLSIGAIAGAWVPEARRAVATLQAVTSERRAVLGPLLDRLIELSSFDVTPSVLAGSQREQLLHEVTQLARVLPEWPSAARDLEGEAREREIRIVRQLLLAVDGTRRDQRARLEREVRLEALGNMAAESLALELAAPVERGTELRRVVDAYLEERRAALPDLGNRHGLERALERLERAARAFDDADPERKDEQRALRGARRDAMTAVNLLLAERGEHEWLDLLEPLSIGERVDRLKQWLGVHGLAAGRADTGAESHGVEGSISE